uniref:Putative septum site-determining protein MinD n=2 Tax=Isochrysidaceae TaxID=418951 RepID=X5CVB8_9EUKA|nr:MinD [Tisochrysis lutea]YP_009873603.1 septum-site determining protein [Isochrysis galbana]AUM82513.1 MinD [Tisochrysis lutea]QKW88486.1 septum-site determining protein [Isochrysis galbana]
MSRIIVITSGKGGVGKTTTTSNIGIALAQLGQKVLLLDADVGLKNLDLLLGLENRIIYNGLDVLTGVCRLTQALIQDKRQSNLTFFPLSSNQLKSSITKDQIQDLIDQLKNNYDFILIDSPAGIDEGFQVAIHAAQEALVVVTPEVTSIRDADKVIGLLEAKGISNINLLINRIKPEMVKAENMMSVSDVKDILGVPLIGVVPDSEQVITASNRGEPLVLEEKLSIPGLAFINTAQRLMGEVVDFIDFDSPPSKNPLKRLIKNLVRRPNASY